MSETEEGGRRCSAGTDTSDTSCSHGMRVDVLDSAGCAVCC